MGLSVDRAYLKKAEHACGMNSIWHILVYLDDECPLFRVGKCKKNKTKNKQKTKQNAGHPMQWVSK